MDRVRLTVHHEPALENPVFIEGLPGVGNVGKLAADHLVDVTDAQRWITIHCTDFPPQVMVQEDGTVRRVGATLWTAKATGGRDLVLMTGDFQPLSPEGQHEMVDAVLERLQHVGCTELYTMGGYGLGTSVDEADVLGAATDTDTVARLQSLGVRFEEDEPGGGIIGASGLFLGLGQERGMEGACLMGETSGYMVDPKAARAVLAIVAKIVDLGDLDMESLDDKAHEMDRIQSQLAEADMKAGMPRADDLQYIG